MQETAYFIFLCLSCLLFVFHFIYSCFSFAFVILVILKYQLYVIYPKVWLLTFIPDATWREIMVVSEINIEISMDLFRFHFFS